MGKVSRCIGLFLIAGFFIAATAPHSLADSGGGVTAKGKSGGFVTLLSPKDGDELPFNRAVIVKYKMATGEKGNHVHFHVDGENIGMTRIRSGSFDLGKLKQGKRKITLLLVNTHHIPLGVEVSIMVAIP